MKRLNHGVGSGGEDEDDEDEPGDVMDDLTSDDIFHFIPLASREVEIGEPGPGPSTLGASQYYRRFLPDNDDERVYDEYMGAGQVIEMDQHLHERWEALFGQDDGPDGDGDVDMEVPVNGFEPFASELN